MFAESAKRVIDHAKGVAFSRRQDQLTLAAVATALLMDSRSGPWLAQGLRLDIDVLTRVFPPVDMTGLSDGKIPLSQEVRLMLALAKDLLRTVPGKPDPSLVALAHLTAAMACSLPETVTVQRAPGAQQII